MSPDRSKARDHAPGIGARIGRALRPGWVRWTLAAATACAVLAVTLLPLATVLVENWARQDMDMRSRLIQRSVQERVAVLPSNVTTDMSPFFQRLTEDERLLAIAFCASDNTLMWPTPQMPAGLSCGRIPHGKAPVLDAIYVDGTHLHVGSYPMRIGGVEGHLVVLHDLAFIDDRAIVARRYTLFALASAYLGFGAVVLGGGFLLLRRWKVRPETVGANSDTASSVSPISREFRSLLREISSDRRNEGIHVDWSPDTLRRLLIEELPGAEVLVVSNREPYIHNKAENGDIELQLPASGLVSALEPITRTCGGTWIAHGSGSADRETVDEHDRIAVPPASPEYRLRRVWLSDEELEGYYFGAANEGLWPLCHIVFVRPTFRESDWERYRAVNRRFAEAVVAEATCEDPIVLVQDYHFALLPRMIREKLPRATIITFWHIPWPNAETFGICPWRKEIVEGLLGSSILGFHTRQHCNNFIEAADRFIESRIDREQLSVTLGGADTLIRPYPISIEWPPSALAGQKPVEDCRAAVRERLGLGPDVRLAVGIERFDYTKGILDRMAAVDDLFTRRPDWKERLVFLQAAAPTRSSLEAYSNLQADAIRLAETINAKHGTANWRPIVLSIRHHDQREVYELFRAADVCIVSSLHDGMNLVAKEFVAARDDLKGVLVLSSFAGASRELSEALIANPYDTRAMAEALHQALVMPEEEQATRLSLMREVVHQYNVYRWAAQMLLDAARIRKRNGIGDNA